jgi:hypothetical protein
MSSGGLVLVSSVVRWRNGTKSIVIVIGNEFSVGSLTHLKEEEKK